VEVKGKGENGKVLFTLLNTARSRKLCRLFPDPAKSPEVFDSIRESLTKPGLQNLARSLVC
jgi:hypothetical protein